MAQKKKQKQQTNTQSQNSPLNNPLTPSLSTQTTTTPPTGTNPTPQSNPPQGTNPTTQSNPWNFVIGQDAQGNVLTLNDLKTISQQIPGLDLSLSSKGDQSVLLNDPYIAQYNDLLLKNVYPAWQQNLQKTMEAVDEANKGIDEYNKWIMGESPMSTPHQRFGAGLTPWGTSPYGGSLLKGRPIAPPPFQPPPPLEKMPRGSSESSASIKIGTPEPNKPSSSKNTKKPLMLKDSTKIDIKYGKDKRADQTLAALASDWDNWDVLKNNITILLDKVQQNNIDGDLAKHLFQKDQDIEIRFKDTQQNDKSFHINFGNNGSMAGNLYYYVAKYMTEDDAYLNDVANRLQVKPDVFRKYKNDPKQMAMQVVQTIKSKIDRVRQASSNKSRDERIKELENVLGHIKEAFSDKISVLLKHSKYVQDRAKEILNKYDTDLSNPQQVVDDISLLLSLYMIRKVVDIANQQYPYQYIKY